ncbi:MAG: hypothetical protein AB7S54_12420 [Bacteroidales bacterium]
MKALKRLKELPERNSQKLEQPLCPDVFPDGVESPVHRPPDAEHIQGSYSGKKLIA